MVRRPCRNWVIAYASCTPLLVHGILAVHILYCLGEIPQRTGLKPRASQPSYWCRVSSPCTSLRVDGLTSHGVDTGDIYEVRTPATYEKCRHRRHVRPYLPGLLTVEGFLFRGGVPARANICSPRRLAEGKVKAPLNQNQPVFIRLVDTIS